MDDARIRSRLSELGLELPPVPTPMASYIPVTVVGELAFVAGQVPIVDGSVVNPGTLGAGVSVEDGASAAARAALQSLAALRGALGDSFGRLRRIAQVTVFVAATPDFTEHAQVANGASDLLVSVLGEEGQHARAAVGMSSLPLGTAVEVAVTAQVDPA